MINKLTLVLVIVSTLGFISCDNISSPTLNHPNTPYYVGNWRSGRNEIIELREDHSFTNTIKDTDGNIEEQGSGSYIVEKETVTIDENEYTTYTLTTTYTDINVQGTTIYPDAKFEYELSGNTFTITSNGENLKYSRETEIFDESIRDLISISNFDNDTKHITIEIDESLNSKSDYYMEIRYYSRDFSIDDIKSTNCSKTKNLSELTLPLKLNWGYDVRDSFTWGDTNFSFQLFLYNGTGTFIGCSDVFNETVTNDGSEYIGKTENDFVYNRDLMRSQETDLGKLIADAMLWYVNENKNPVDFVIPVDYTIPVDFAITNGGAICDSITKIDIPEENITDENSKEGYITEENIYRVLPYYNTLTILELTGEEVISLFEKDIAAITSGDGAFPQVSGVSFTKDYTNMTCSNIRINGSEVISDKTYTIITNSYIAAGGDGYNTFKNAINKKDLGVYCGTYLKDYIEDIGTIKIPTDSRITIVETTVDK